jgi:hypothetical protein
MNLKIAPFVEKQVFQNSELKLLLMNTYLYDISELATAYITCNIHSGEK